MKKVSQRLVAAGIALLLQGLFVAVLLRSVQIEARRKDMAGELIFLLPPRAEAMMPMWPQSELPAPLFALLPLFRPFAAPMPAPAQPSYTAPPPAMADLGQALFGCAPENYTSLSIRNRMLCPRPGAQMTILDAPNLMGLPSQVKDEAHWATELARENSPLALPCFGGVDLLCVAESIANWSVPDPDQWPVYETKRYPAEDFYKIEQDFGVWHEAHPQE